MAATSFSSILAFETSIPVSKLINSQDVVRDFLQIVGRRVLACKRRTLSLQRMDLRHMKLMRVSDRICGNRWRCHARGVTRMVPMGCCVPLLSSQGIPKGRKLEHQDTGRHCVDLVHSAPVSGTYLKDLLSGELTNAAPFSCPS